MTPKFEDLQHEAGDRTFVIGKQFSEFVAEHAFVAARTDLKERAAKIEADLADLYQEIWRCEAGPT